MNSWRLWWQTNVKLWQRLDESDKVTPTIRTFRTVQHAMANYEQTKKILSYSFPKGNVEDVGIQAIPLHFWN